MAGLASIAALQKILMFLYEHMYALLLTPFALQESKSIFKSASVLEHIKAPFPQCLQRFVQARKLVLGPSIVSQYFYFQFHHLDAFVTL